MNRWLPPGRRPARTRLDRLLRLALPLAFALPLPTGASEQLALGDGGSGQTGDPLDTNDCGGSSVGDSDRPPPYFPAIRDYLRLQPVIDGRRILLIPVNEGGRLTFRLVIVDERETPRPVDAR